MDMMSNNFGEKQLKFTNFQQVRDFKKQHPFHLLRSYFSSFKRLILSNANQVVGSGKFFKTFLPYSTIWQKGLQTFF
jgi:hypothetical protein